MICAFVTPPLQRDDTRFHFRQHPSRDRTRFNHLLNLRNRQAWHAAFRVFRIGPNSMRIRNHHNLFSLHRRRHRPSGRISIHIQLPAGVIARDRRDTRNRIRLHQQLQQPGRSRI